MGQILGQLGCLGIQSKQVPQILLRVVLVRQNCLDVGLELHVVDVQDELGHDGVGGGEDGGDGGPAGLAQGDNVLEWVLASK